MTYPDDGGLRPEGPRARYHMGDLELPPPDQSLPGGLLAEAVRIQARGGCGYAWRDGWGVHTCHLPTNPHGMDHVCNCDIRSSAVPHRKKPEAPHAGQPLALPPSGAQSVQAPPTQEGKSL